MRKNLNEVTKIINEYRERTAFFDKDSFMKYCKENGIPYIQLLFHALKSRNIILKNKDMKRYCFALSQPIYIGVLQSIYEEITKNYNKPKNRKEDFISISIEEAISLLKENGYLIYKPA